MKTQLAPLFGLLLAVSLVMGCASGGAPARSQTGDTSTHAACAADKATAGRHATVNGLRMYYEIHGTGRPLVLLHGALTTIETSFGKVLPTLACTRRVIAIEQQAHGRTADIDRPLTYEQMADDVGELLRQLGIREADFFGYSMGGATAMQVAVRHPILVRKMAVVSGAYSNDGYKPEVLGFLRAMDPGNSESWAKEFREEFQRVAPRPEQWPAPIARIKELVSAYRGLRPDQMRAIKAPALFIVGDDDVITLAHTLEMSRLLPHAQLAVFPGSNHYPDMVNRPDWLLSMIPPFLDAAMPEQKKPGGQ